MSEKQTPEEDMNIIFIGAVTVGLILGTILIFGLYLIMGKPSGMNEPSERNGVFMDQADDPSDPLTVKGSSGAERADLQE
jgi:hypothetical protein